MRVAFPFILLMLLIGITANSQVSFQIKPSAREIGKEDMLSVSYELSGINNLEDFQQPSFSKWKVLSGPSSSSQMISINGKVQKKISFDYILQPASIGTLSLPGTTAVNDNNTYTCPAITINVKNTAHVAGVQQQSTAPAVIDLFGTPNKSVDEDVERESYLKPNENPVEKISKNLFVKASVSKNSCYVGEPLLVTYKLYTRLHSQSRLTKQPTFTGCSVSEMTTDDMLPEVEKINGKNFKVYTIRRVQIFPLQTGELVLDAIDVENKVSFLQQGSDYRSSY